MKCPEQNLSSSKVPWIYKISSKFFLPRIPWSSQFFLSPPNFPQLVFLLLPRSSSNLSDVLLTPTKLHESLTASSNFLKFPQLPPRSLNIPVVSPTFLKFLFSLFFRRSSFTSWVLMLPMPGRQSPQLNRTYRPIKSWTRDERLYNGVRLSQVALTTGIESRPFRMRGNQTYHYRRYRSC